MSRILLTTLLAGLSACAGDGETKDADGTGDTGTPTTTAAAFQVLAEGPDQLGAALLSVWGSGADDVWLVGADDGAGPLVLHYDGAAWSRVDTGTTGDLWWVWGDGQGTVFFSGAGGRVIEHEAASGTSTVHDAADPQLTLFGLWGTSATDVWTVGGNVNGARDGGVVHFDGTTWTEVATAPPNGATPRSAFKVWGRATDDVYFVGTQAWIAHWDGAALTTVDPSPVYGTTPLTTVSGDADQVIAVGGFGNAAAARHDGTGWADDSPPPAAIAPGFNGVHVRDGQVVACGVRGAVWSRDAQAAEPWTELEPPVTSYDLHGCWIDPDGFVWSVGGDLVSLTAGAAITDRPDVPAISL